VLALGANVFNMAIVSSATGYAVYRAVCWKLPGIRGRVTAVAFAGWCGTVLASLSCAGQLAWSHTIGWHSGLTAMGGVHMLIGIGEGVISALVLLAIHKTRPEMITESSLNRPQRWAELARYGLLAALGVALFVAPFACSWPDGLEVVATRFGFTTSNSDAIWTAPAPNYQVSALPWGVGATAIAAGLGTVVVFGLALLLGWILVPNREGKNDEVRLV
jgi:cobalt/nickel transport system permease protein